MDSYRIFETGSFQADLARVGRSGLRRIESKLREHVYSRLRSEPHFGPNIKRLRNWEPPVWRYRIGAWRFFYEIDEKRRVVFMTVADHRGRAYTSVGHNVRSYTTATSEEAKKPGHPKSS